MAFKEFHDLDGNGLSDVSQSPEENKFDMLESAEVEEILEQEEPDNSELGSKSATEEAQGFEKEKDIQTILNADDDWDENIDEAGTRPDNRIDNALMDGSESWEVAQEDERPNNSDIHMALESGIDDAWDDEDVVSECEADGASRMEGILNNDSNLESEQPEQDDAQNSSLLDATEDDGYNRIEHEWGSRFEITPEIQEALMTEKNTAYFWSGLGPNGQYLAQEKAVEAGGTTLENQLEINNIDMPEWSFMDANSQRAWRDVSACYADNCSGEVNVFAGKIREGSVFESTEYDRLVNNENVTSISMVNIETGEKQTIYNRYNPEDNASKVVYEENGQNYVKFVKGAELDDEINRY